jgi:hypothetical protein
MSKKISKERLTQIKQNLKPIDVEKYVGKINFGIDGLQYQLKIRNGWK